MPKTIITFVGGRCVTSNCRSSAERGVSSSEQARFKRDADLIRRKQESKTQCFGRSGDFKLEAVLPADSSLALEAKNYDGNGRRVKRNADALKYEAARGNPLVTLNPGLLSAAAN